MRVIIFYLAYSRAPSIAADSLHIDLLSLADLCDHLVEYSIVSETAMYLFFHAQVIGYPPLPVNDTAGHGDEL